MTRCSVLVWFWSLAMLSSAIALAQAPVSDFDSEVYTALVNRATEDLKQSELSPIVIAATTVSLKEGVHYNPVWDSGKSLAESIAQGIPEAARPVVDELVRIGERPRLVKLKMNALRQGIKVHVVPDVKLREILSGRDRSETDWQRLKARYGAASVLSLSRVGWHADSGQALVVISVTCGSLCGSGHLVLLERRFGIWIIVKTHQLWIA
jgi:hypothetical protein